MHGKITPKVLSSLVIIVVLAVASVLHGQATAAQPTQKVSFDVTNADVRNILTTLAGVSGKDIILSDDVKGKISIKLDNVSWEEAMQTITQNKGLAVTQKGKIVRIAAAGPGAGPSQESEPSGDEGIGTPEDANEDLPPPGMAAPQSPKPSGPQTTSPQPSLPGSDVPVTQPVPSAVPRGIPQPVVKDKAPPVSPPPLPSSPRPTHPQPIRPIALSSRDVTTMNFDNIELRDLIRFTSNVMGKNFIFDENVVKGKVTILSPKNLTKDQAFRVFETVMASFGFALVPTPEAIKIVRSTDAKGMALEKLEGQQLLDLPPEDRFVTYVHNLGYLDATSSIGILKPMMAKDAHLAAIPSTNSLIMIDTASNIQRIKKILTEIDIPVSKQLGTLKVYNVQHTNAADLAKTIQSLLTQDKKIQTQTAKERVFVTSYGSTNSLLISAPPEDMREIERIIIELDTLRPQVLVEAAIIEVTTSRGEEFGVEWIAGVTGGSDNTRGAIGGFTRQGVGLLGVTSAIASNASDPAKAVAAAAGVLSTGFNVGVIGGTIHYNGVEYPALGAFLRALSTRDGVNILSTPQLLTVNNEEAEIIVGENIPYLTSSRLDTSGNPTYSFDYRDVGIKLKIKPQINKDGFVNLNIYQEVSKVTEASTTIGSSAAPAPTTLKRSTKTTVVVKDSQTVVISGLIKDDSTDTRQGIPFLSSIPVLGYLFGYSKKVSEKTNLLVFLTPRIVYTAESLQQISNQKKQEQDMLIQKDRKQK
ncbi:MAG: Type II secretion system protein D precursor [Syntrophorhabdus sp. PtaU1.Bin002]|nr:MAG: Type II secretion system protein D precursor [Syntrophorhabdus sp. PtaU1.Bin002]